jgi:hypothetical protein
MNLRDSSDIANASATSLTLIPMLANNSLQPYGDICINEYACKKQVNLLIATKFRKTR